MKEYLKVFIPVAIGITFLCGIMYGSFQQYIRHSANHPQIELSQEIASAYTRGSAYTPLTQAVDVEKSLLPFVIIYDASGSIRFTTAVLDKKTPILPKGVFDYAKTHGQNTFTWEPKNDVRLAAVITYAHEKLPVYVLVGRSLKDSESLTSLLFSQITFGWIITMLITFLVTKFMFSFQRKHI